MRITDVEADIVRILLSTRFSGSVYQIESRCTIVTRVHTDEGLVSEVYSGDERTGYHLLKDLVVGPMKEAVVGEDPTAIERCWQKMFALTPRIADKAIAMRAVAAIDVALWDITGKALGVPVRSPAGWVCRPRPGGAVCVLRAGTRHRGHGAGFVAPTRAGNRWCQAQGGRVTVQTWRGELAEGWSRIAGAGGGGYVIYLGWMRKSTSALRTGMC